jgi:hypothetical protein
MMEAMALSACWMLWLCWYKFEKLFLFQGLINYTPIVMWCTWKMGLQLLGGINHHITNLTLENPCFLIPCEGLATTLQLLQNLLWFYLHSDNNRLII